MNLAVVAARLTLYERFLQISPRTLTWSNRRAPRPRRSSPAIPAVLKGISSAGSAGVPIFSMP